MPVVSNHRFLAEFSLDIAVNALFGGLSGGVAIEQTGTRIPAQLRVGIVGFGERHGPLEAPHRTQIPAGHDMPRHAARRLGLGPAFVNDA